MTFTKAYLGGLRVALEDGRVFDILPEGIDAGSTTEPTVLSLEYAESALLELFADEVGDTAEEPA